MKMAVYKGLIQLLCSSFVILICCLYLLLYQYSLFALFLFLILFDSPFCLNYCQLIFPLRLTDLWFFLAFLFFFLFYNFNSLQLTEEFNDYVKTDSLISVIKPAIAANLRFCY